MRHVEHARANLRGTQQRLDKTFAAGLDGRLPGIGLNAKKKRRKKVGITKPLMEEKIEVHISFQPKIGFLQEIYQTYSIQIQNKHLSSNRFL